VSEIWEDFISNLRDNTGQMPKTEIINLVKDLSSDTDAFLKKQGEKLALYLNQLAEGKITPEQLEGYVKDINTLIKIQALKMGVKTKARARKFIRGITTLILKELLTKI